MSSISYAGEDFFAGGGHNVYRDINTPDDSYFGGFNCTWDSNFPSDYKRDINLSILTESNEKNTLYSAYGASKTTMDNAPGIATIDGDVSLTIRNSTIAQFSGGCFVPHSDSPMLITGKVSVQIFNSSFSAISYGVAVTSNELANPMCTVGSVEMLLDRTDGSSIILSSSTGGVNQSYAVLGDIHCTVQNESTLTNLYGTGGINRGSKARSGNVQGSVYIDVVDSQLVSIICTYGGDVEKDFHINLQHRSRVANLYLSRNYGYLNGKLICLVNGGYLNNVYLVTTNPHQKYIEITVQNDGYVNSISQRHTINTALQQAVYYEHIVCKSLDGGKFYTINCCLPKDHGNIGLFEVILQGTGLVDTLNVGNAIFEPTTKTDKAIVTFAGGGTVNHLAFHPYNVGESVLRFANGESAYPKNVQGAPTTIEICENTTVHMEDCNQPLQAQKNIQIAGTLNLTHNPAWTTSSIQAEDIALTGSIVCAQEPSVPTIIQAAKNLELSGSIALTESSLVATHIQAEHIQVLDTFAFSQDSFLPTTFQADTFQLAGAMSLVKPSSVETLIQAKTIQLGGTLTLPANAPLLRITTEEHFIADGAVINFKSQQKSITSTVGPIIFLDGAVSGGVEVHNPLTIQLGALDLVPFIESKTMIPIVKVESLALGRPDLFEPLRKGLVWGDMAFDPTILTWGLINITPSPEYYGYTTGRKATSWLRENAMHMLGHRSSKALLEGHEGLWMNAQGGAEQLQSLLGTAGMFWAMASIGYDHHYRMPYYAYDIAHGISFGAAASRTKLTELDSIRSTIVTALANMYIGISHVMGWYTTLGVQAAAGRVQNNNEGFEVNQQWTEIVPSGSFELGWKISINRDFALIPRVKGLVEYIPEQSLSFESFGTPETILLSKSINANAIGGIGITYDLKRSARLDMLLCLDVDYIQGLMGSYGATSKVFSKEFVETNKDKVLRVSLGTDMQFTRKFCLGIHGFVDVLDTKGIGGQLTTTYTF